MYDYYEVWQLKSLFKGVYWYCIVYAIAGAVSAVLKDAPNTGAIHQGIQSVMYTRSTTSVFLV